MTKIDLYDGKYTVIHENGVNFRALRNGEEWRDLTGDGLVLAMTQRIEELEEEQKLSAESYNRILLERDLLIIETHSLEDEISDYERIINDTKSISNRELLASVKEFLKQWKKCAFWDLPEGLVDSIKKLKELTKN